MPVPMTLRHRLQYLLVLLFRGLIGLLPHRVMPGLGRALGALAYRVDRRDRARALDNVAYALPELAAPERAALVRRSFRELGAAAFETLSALRMTPEELRERVVLDGWEHAEEAAAGGRGLLLLSAHLGCWEVAIAGVALRLGPVHVVSNRLHNPLFDRELRRERERFGIEIIDRQGAARRMYKVLVKGGRMVVALDQRTRPEEAIEVPFFGRPSLTSPLPAYLSQWTGAPVVPVFVSSDGERYRVRVEPAIIPPPGSANPEAGVVAHLTARYLEVIEREIRRRPEDWVWFYKRWRPKDAEGAAKSSLAGGK